MKKSRGFVVTDKLSPCPTFFARLGLDKKMLVLNKHFKLIPESFAFLVDHCWKPDPEGHHH